MRLLALPAHGLEPRLQRLEKIELVAEFLVERRIGNVAARRHIDIVQHERPRAVQRHRKMPRMAASANVAALVKCERQTGEGGDAVITLLAGHRDMVEAERPQLELRKLELDAFDLLQAEHIGPIGRDEAAYQIEPEPDRIDVPGGEAEAH